MNSLHFGVQIVDGLQKVSDGFLDELLIEATTFHEDVVHVLQAHLRNLKNEHKVLPLWPVYSERAEELSDPASAWMVAVLHLIDTGVQRRFAMAKRVAYVNFESDIAVLPENMALVNGPVCV